MNRCKSTVGGARESEILGSTGRDINWLLKRASPLVPKNNYFMRVPIYRDALEHQITESSNYFSIRITSY